MKLTDIKIRRAYPAGKLRAVFSITFDDAFAVHDIKLLEGEGRMFVAMPSRKDEKGTFRDIAHPISPQIRDMIEAAAVSAYSNFLEKEEKSC